MNRRPHTGVLVLVVTLAVVVASCTSDSADSTTTTEGLTTTTPTTIAAPTTTVAAIEETTTTTKVAETTTTEAAAISDSQAATLAAYETAWNDGNEDAFRALFASPDVLLEDPENETRTGDIDFIVGQGVGRRAMGIELSIDGCSPWGETVVCTAEFDGPVPIAMNVVPWRDRYVFSFEDGQITHIKYSCIICWDGNAEDLIHTWVDTVDKTVSLKFGYILVNTEEDGAAWLEWAPKWEEAGKP